MRALKTSILLLLPLLSTTISSSPSCDGSTSDEDKIAHAAIFLLYHTTTTVISWTKFSPIAGPIHLFHNLFDEDGVKVGDLIDCHLRAYHLDRITSKLQNFQGAFNNWREDKQKLLELLDQVEQLDTISCLQSSKDNVKAAIFPVLAPWATMHLAVYKQLINKYPNDDAVKKLKNDSDAWLIFYIRLMLRYSRPHRILAMRNMKVKIWWLQYFYDVSSIQNNRMMTSVAKILEPWSKLAWSKTTENKIKLIRDSCSVASNSIVQFRRVGECFGTAQTCFKSNTFCRRRCDKVRWYFDEYSWLTCTNDDHLCRIQQCDKTNSKTIKELEDSFKNVIKLVPAGAPPMIMNTTWSCPLARFRVMTESTQLTMLQNKISIEDEIHLEHRYINETSYWLRIRESEAPLPNWALGLAGISNLQPKYCGDISKGLNWKCAFTDLRIMKWDLVDQNILDGSFVLIGSESADIYEVYKYGSECVNSDWVHPPF